jgi:hypothetical protein
MQELHIINIILSSLPESYARARSNWNTIPVVERTVINLTGKLKAEEKILACYSKPITTTLLFMHRAKLIDGLLGRLVKTILQVIIIMQKEK